MLIPYLTRCLRSQAICAAILFAAAAHAAGCGAKIGPSHGETSGAHSPATSFEPTPARLERGRYLAEGPMRCFMCHSELDWNAPGAPPLPGKKGAGGIFPEEGLPIQIISPNITPDKATGAGGWTDDQLAKSIREGIGHKGRVLIPFMPYWNFNVLSDEDLASIIVYLRTIEPIANELPEITLPDGVQDMLKPLPVKSPAPGPNPSDLVERGAYLARLSNCASCHTPVEPSGRRMKEMEYAGGLRFKGAWGEVTSTNLTPDASGIPYYDEALFISSMRTGFVKARKLNSIMPWGYYRHMTDDDLKAIFAYLLTLKPVEHRVDNTEPPRKCEKCGGVHGYAGSSD